jgi:hypothetical protein
MKLPKTIDGVPYSSNDATKKKLATGNVIGDKFALAD